MQSNLKRLGRGSLLSTILSISILFANVAAADVSPTAGWLGWQGVDIGNAIIPGEAVVRSNSVQITAAGADVGGTQDECFFFYSAQSGDFDLSVRVASLENRDVWTKAG